MPRSLDAEDNSGPIWVPAPGVWGGEGGKQVRTSTSPKKSPPRAPLRLTLGVQGEERTQVRAVGGKAGSSRFGGPHPRAPGLCTATVPVQIRRHPPRTNFPRPVPAASRIPGSRGHSVRAPGPHPCSLACTWRPLLSWRQPRSRPGSWARRVGRLWEEPRAQGTEPQHARCRTAPPRPRAAPSPGPGNLQEGGGTCPVPAWGLPLLYPGAPRLEGAGPGLRPAGAQGQKVKGQRLQGPD